jgi:choline dehydrogenase
MSERKEFDYIIVRAGSAGCVLAACLSQASTVRVALLEAGGRDDAPKSALPLVSQLLTTKYDKGIQRRAGLITWVLHSLLPCESD